MIPTRKPSVEEACAIYKRLLTIQDRFATFAYYREKLGDKFVDDMARQLGINPMTHQPVATDGSKQATRR